MAAKSKKAVPTTITLIAEVIDGYALQQRQASTGTYVITIPIDDFDNWCDQFGPVDDEYAELHERMEPQSIWLALEPQIQDWLNSSSMHSGLNVRLRSKLSLLQDLKEVQGLLARLPADQLPLEA